MIAGAHDAFEDPSDRVPRAWDRSAGIKARRKPQVTLNGLENLIVAVVIGRLFDEQVVSRTPFELRIPRILILGIPGVIRGSRSAHS